VITKRTVLVLGAGASSHYGFPLGEGLRDRVCGLANDNVLVVACNESGLDRSDLQDFTETLIHIGYTSVDWFLEEWQSYTDVGKLAIAAALIPIEKPERLFPPEATGGHWYEQLVNLMDAGSDAFAENRLSVITFNYDRSLEHYLWTVLKTRHRGDEERAARDFRSVEIVHVHGSLGAFPLPGSPGHAYAPNKDPKTIRDCADKIIVVGEAEDSASEFGRARELLGEAERVVFLGFGYHEESVRRLGIFNEPWNDERRERTYVAGTLHKVPTVDVEVIRGDILNGALQQVTLVDVTTFLKNEFRLNG